jgi:ribosomal protein S18 acetylase RimI-like enzyme
MHHTTDAHTDPTTEVRLDVIETPDDLPAWLTLDELAGFLHRSLKPYEDPLPTVRRGLDDAFSTGGFLVLASTAERVLGALAMLRTGMEGYIPANFLLFVAVDPTTRGQGLGRRIVERAIEHADGDVKLHVEYDNPARRLYERIGFSSKYAEMRHPA